MDKNQIDKMIDDKIKEQFFNIRDELNSIEKDVNILTEHTEKRLIEIRKNLNEKKSKNVEYSDDIKHLISDDTNDRNQKLLSEIREILPNLISSKRDNLSYIWLAIVILFAMQIMFFILKN